MRVAVNGAYSIISMVSRAADVRAQVMELINSPGVDYSMIGGLSEVSRKSGKALNYRLPSPNFSKNWGSNPPPVSCSTVPQVQARPSLQRP